MDSRVVGYLGSLRHVRWPKRNNRPRTQRRLQEGWRRGMQTGSIWSRSVLVTGASRGIGKGIARVFARAGAKVLIVARDGRQAEAAAEEIIAAGGVATPFTADVTNAEQMREAARMAATRHGGLD